MNARDEAIGAFWGWFVRAFAPVQHGEDAAESDLEALLDRLRSIDSHLGFEVCTNAEPHDLVVTANGREELFDLVGRIISAAPSVDGWTFTALKPPRPDLAETTYEGVALDPARMWFLPLVSPSAPSDVGLRVGLVLDGDESSDSVLAGVWVVLDTLLGERAATLELAHVEFTSLPADPAADGYIELPELRAYLDWRKRRSPR